MSEYTMICPNCGEERNRCTIRQDGTFQIRSDQVSRHAGENGLALECLACSGTASFDDWLENSSGEVV